MSTCLNFYESDTTAEWGKSTAQQIQIRFNVLVLTVYVALGCFYQNFQGQEKMIVSMKEMIANAEMKIGKWTKWENSTSN